MAPLSPIFHLLILLSIFRVCRSQYNWTDNWNNHCTYSLYVGTGTMSEAGTNATISLGLHFEQGMSIICVDLVSFGKYVNNDQYDYFEPGNIDMFTMVGPCDGTINLCSANFSSDSFNVPRDEKHLYDAIKPAWYITFAEITVSSFGKPSKKYSFDFFKWLGPPPYKPFAINSGCKDSANQPSKMSEAIVL